MPRDLFEDIGEMQNKGQGRDLFKELGIKHPMQEQGEIIQKRHPKTAKALAWLADTPVGKQFEKDEPFMRATNKLTEEAGLSDIGGGLLEGAQNVPISILNTPSYIGEKLTGKKFPQLPYSDLSVFEEEGKRKGPARAIGNLAGMLISGGPLSRLFAGHQAVNALNPRNAKMLEQAFRSAGSGYSMMGEGDNRELGALIGAGAPLAIGAIERAAPYVDAMLPFGGLGRNAGKQFAKRTGEFNEEYNQIKNKFRKSGATKNFKDPNIYEDAVQLEPKMDKKNIEEFKNFLKDPTLEGAHHAKSEIKDFIRALEKKTADKNKGVWASGDEKSWKTANRMVKDIDKSMTEAFLSSKNPELVMEYTDLGERFAKNMGPYRNIKEFAKHANKKAKNSTLSKAMLANDEFMLSEEAKNVPGLKIREIIDKFPAIGKLFRGL